jgi:hypothetical protein
LKGPTLEIVKRTVQQEDCLGIQVQGVKLATELVEGMRTQPAANQGTQVVRAKIHFDGSGCVQGIRLVAEGSDLGAHGA